MSFLENLLSEESATKYMAQGSEEWEQIRCGRFTSSRISVLLECGTRDMTKEELALRPKTGAGSKTTKVADPTQMSAKGLAYVNEKVAEVLTGGPKPKTYAYPLVYGNETEPIAADFFAKKFNVELEQVGFQTFGEHAGGSPDRIFEYNGIKHGLEIKCPYNSENQINYLMMTDMYDLKRNYPDYYWQCVSIMLFMDIPVWHFVTFDPRFIDDAMKMTHIIIDNKSSEVQNDQARIVSALEVAIEKKLKILHSLDITKKNYETIKLY